MPSKKLNSFNYKWLVRKKRIERVILHPGLTTCFINFISIYTYLHMYTYTYKCMYVHIDRETYIHI